jgi:single-stranded DNA-binding protein
MTDINTVVISGRLATDPALMFPTIGTICNFTIVTKGDEEVFDSAHVVEVRGKFAAVCHKYLRRGREVIVSGKLIADAWTHVAGPEGRTYVSKIIAKQVQFLGAPPTQEELAKPMQIDARSPSDEEPADPFVRKECVVQEFAPTGRYRIRMIKRDDQYSVDIREYVNGRFTIKGIRVPLYDEAAFLKNALCNIIEYRDYLMKS